MVYNSCPPWKATFLINFFLVKQLCAKSLHYKTNAKKAVWNNNLWLLLLLFQKQFENTFTGFLLSSTLRLLFLWSVLISRRLQPTGQYMITLLCVWRWRHQYCAGDPKIHKKGILFGRYNQHSEKCNQSSSTARSSANAKTKSVLQLWHVLFFVFFSERGVNHFWTFLWSCIFH